MSKAVSPPVSSLGLTANPKINPSTQKWVAIACVITGVVITCIGLIYLHHYYQLSLIGTISSCIATSLGGIDFLIGVGWLLKLALQSSSKNLVISDNRTLEEKLQEDPQEGPSFYSFLTAVPIKPILNNRGEILLSDVKSCEFSLNSKSPSVSLKFSYIGKKGLREEMSSNVAIEEIADAFNISQDQVVLYARKGTLEKCLNALIHKEQKQYFDFSDAELALAGITRESYDALVEGIEEKDFSENKKLYFNTQSNSFCEKQGDVVIKQRKFDDICLATKISFSGGVSKKVYLELNLTQKTVHVRSVEYIELKKKTALAGLSYEKKIYRSTRKTAGIVKSLLCKEKEKNGKKKFTFLTEFCEGGSMNDLRGKLTSKELIQVFADYLRGLGKLHKRGYLHLDLHSGNLLLKEEDGKKRGKLADFGNARPIENLQDEEYLTQQLFNNDSWTPNPDRLAPEIYCNLYRKRLGKYSLSEYEYPISDKADVWSFAATMTVHIYRLSSKNPERLPPFFAFWKNRWQKKMNIHQIYQFVQERLQETPEPENTESLDHLLWEMLQPDPEKRPTAFQAADRLEGFLKNSSE